MTSPLDRRVRLYVYTSHFLSAWGDRMWQFGVGMFMVIIAPESLRLTAVYGLSMGTAILVFGAHVGNMVDRIPRLTAARLTLIIQNLSVAACAVIIYIVIVYKSDIRDLWPGEALLTTCYAVIILVAIVSTLASTGNSIAVERDWIVEICGNSGETLAAMSAAMKGIDLTTNIIAPIVTGQIMAYAGVDMGAIFIAAWNIVSVFVEYYLLLKVYNSVPALRKEKHRINFEQAEPEQTTSTLESSTFLLSGSISIRTHHHTTEHTSKPYDGNDASAGSTRCLSCLQGMLSGVTILVRGWKTFMSYDVAFAGLALSTLYMTVIGFDNITVGYAYTQGVNESIMGILMAAGAAVGIFGTILYPRMHKYLGLVRTGLFGLFLQISVSSLCVASIWAPGSPFDPFIRGERSMGHTNLSSGETEHNGTVDNMTARILYMSLDEMTTPDSSVNETSTMTYQSDKISIILMMAGIVGARCGLWITDLTITQLFLTQVRETERGVVLGVQTSLNQLMNMLKFIMVIVAPEPELFGILVLLSFGFVCFGWLLYAKYSRSTRGHLFHFNRIFTSFGPSKYEKIEG